MDSNEKWTQTRKSNETRGYIKFNNLIRLYNKNA